MTTNWCSIRRSRGSRFSISTTRGGSFRTSVDAATGAKIVSDELCVGCKVCTIACPFGTVNYNADTGKVIKCDLCGGDPECAKACPTEAIVYVDANWTGLEKMRAWADKTDAGQQASA
jgi:Fe-S-cluster-containing hydrogenase component 2